MKDIFISYAREDRLRAEQLAHALEAQGWSVFWDRDIPAGETWRTFVGKALDEARCVIVVWSEASIDSRWVREEADDGLERNILVPVLFESLKPPIGFRSVQAADLVHWDNTPTDDAFKRLVNDVARLLGPPPRIEEERLRAKAERKVEADAAATQKAEQHEPSAAAPPGREGSQTKAKRANATAGDSARPGHQAGGTRQQPTTHVHDRPPASPAWLKPVSIAGVGVAAVIIGIQFLPSDPVSEPQLLLPATFDVPGIVRFNASQASITAGDEVTLTWTTSDADRVELLPGGPVALNGSSDVSPTATTEYALVASGPGGETRQSVRVSVSAAPVPDPPTASLRVQPNTIERGGSTTLRWSTTNATSARLNGETVRGSDTRTVRPTSDETYRLVVTGPGGTVERATTVSVTEPPTPPLGADDPLNAPIWIEGGTFQMGSTTQSNEQPVHQVTLSGFWMQEHEVTNEEYARFDRDHQFDAGQDRHPVVNVNWQEAMDYTASRGGSLPTEAQWEFAARGTEGRTYPWGEAAPTCQLAQYFGCDPGGTVEVMSRPDGATPEGVHGLAGNVWEWVADWYGEYDSAAATDPTGPSSGEYRVLRGGSFFYVTGFLRGANRVGYDPGGGVGNLGFRVVWSSAGGQN